MFVHSCICLLAPLFVTASHSAPNPLANKTVPDDFRIVQRILEDELFSNELYVEVWRMAERSFEKKLEFDQYYITPETPRECYIAIIAYTSDEAVLLSGKPHKLYSDFNQRFRRLSDENSWVKFPYKSLYYLLTMALPGVRNKPKTDGNLYRGLRNFQIKPPPKPGDVFYFESFASCTTKRSLALDYVSTNGTIIKILRGGPIMAYGIEAYSYYGTEHEVLVFPRNKFRVKLYKKKRYFHRLVLERIGEQ